MASISTASSSRLSLNQADDGITFPLSSLLQAYVFISLENVTVTANRLSKAFTESKQEEEYVSRLWFCTRY
jgi:hypothetical protein